MRTPSITPIIRAIMAINIIVFIVQSINPQYDRMIVDLFGLHYFTSEKFNPIQLVTYMFVHGGISHLFFNMLSLLLFGPMLEEVWGERKFLKFYFICGIGAGVFYTALRYYDIQPIENLANDFLSNPDGQNFIRFINKLYSNLGVVGNPLKIDNSLIISKEEVGEYKTVVEKLLKDAVDMPMIGASGAIFGVKAGFALLFPNFEFMLFLIPFPVKAKFLLSFWILYDVYAGIQKMPGDNVAHFAHIGGMIFALILIKIWGKDRQSFY